MFAGWAAAGSAMAAARPVCPASWITRHTTQVSMKNNRVAGRAYIYSFRPSWSDLKSESQKNFSRRSCWHTRTSYVSAARTGSPPPKHLPCLDDDYQLQHLIGGRMVKFTSTPTYICIIKNLAPSWSQTDPGLGPRSASNGKLSWNIACLPRKEDDSYTSVSL